MNTELPASRASRWSGSAIRLPNPPLGIVSWFGNSRSYDSIESWCRRDMVSVIRKQPSLRAATADTGDVKNNQACAPLPERDRSIATGTP